MSERLKSMNKFSNEEIIDDLTKELNILSSVELKSSSSTEENVGDHVVHPASCAEDFPSSSGDAQIEISDTRPKSKQTATADMDETEKAETFRLTNEESDADSDTDAIDEDKLKDAEMDLTNDQKEERRVIAEELKSAGNEAFKCGDYTRSLEKYTEGLNLCPLSFPQQRSVLYCNLAAAKMKLDKFASAAKYCTKAIELDNKYLKAYVRRAQCYESTDKLDESLADYKKILELDPSHKDAQKAVRRLPPLIEEKNEKLKTEVLGKLKDLGNMILKPFGLSTDSFQVEQDPESKGYKINFKQ